MKSPPNSGVNGTNPVRKYALAAAAKLKAAAMKASATASR